MARTQNSGFILTPFLLHSKCVMVRINRGVAVCWRCIEDRGETDFAMWFMEHTFTNEINIFIPFTLGENHRDLEKKLAKVGEENL